MSQSVCDQDIEPMPQEQMNKFYVRMSPKLSRNQAFSDVRQQLEDEVVENYNSSLCKAVVDYILIDSQEKNRLKIFSTPLTSPRRYIIK